MSLLRLLAWSSVGKKVLMALTGLALILFLVGHLLGNLLLFVGPASFNAYAHKLVGLGPLLIAVELGLVLVFVLHALSGAAVWLGKRRARPVGYEASGDAGGASRKTVSSRTMLWTGAVVFVFLVVHLKTFKYGPGVAEGYTASVGGETARDLYRLVAEMFSREHPWYVLFYVVCMLLMGLHLRHAFWSAFQSLGMHHPRLTPVIYGTGVALAVLLAAGFIALPLWLLIRGGPA